MSDRENLELIRKSTNVSEWSFLPNLTKDLISLLFITARYK
jgi:hypothetical protein